MDWMVPKNKLDRDQISILNKIYDGHGNYFVKGCPGTGKSVLLAHLYREYKATHPNNRICVLTYTHALIDCIKDGLRDASLQIFTIPKFSSMATYDRSGLGWDSHWDLILVDEAQDMQPSWADAIVRSGARIVFFGDFKQSIYGETLNEHDFIEKFNPEQLELGTIYRLTRSTKQLVQSVFPGNLVNATVGNLVADTDIQLIKSDSVENDYKSMADKIARYASPQRPAAVLFRHREFVLRFLRNVVSNFPRGLYLNDNLNDYLRKSGSIFRFLGNGYGNFLESDSVPIVYLMTWHSAKGLDFNTVALPAISEKANGGRGCRGCNPMDEGPLYVALTRGRLNLFISYSKDDDCGVIRRMATCSSVRSMTYQDDQIGAVGDDNLDAQPLF